MRSAGSSKRNVSSASPRRIGSLVRAVLLPASLLLGFASAPSAASAVSAHGPRYSLSILEGATTLPEFEQAGSISASVSPDASISLSIIRNGTTINRALPPGESPVSGIELRQAPAVGDEVLFEAPIGTPIARVKYDGLPTIDPTVCVGSTNFSGTNSSGYTVEGRYYAETVLHPYHRGPELHRTAFGEAQVKTLSGTTFGGSFLLPLALGQNVEAIESLKTSLPGEATYTYTSETVRPVGACPVPPPVFNPPPAPLLQGSLAKLLRTTIRNFLKHGARDEVTINQAGTIVQDLYLENGKLPAFAAASASKHHKKVVPPALLLARGTATAKAAGKLSVLLKLTTRGRRKLKAAHNAKVVLVTTLHSASGAKVNLARHTITLHR